GALRAAARVQHEPRDVQGAGHDRPEEQHREDEQVPDVDAPGELGGRQAEHARHEHRDDDARDGGEDRELAPQHHPQGDEPQRERQLPPDGAPGATKRSAHGVLASSSTCTSSTGSSRAAPIRSHTAWSGPAATVSMSVAPTMPAVAVVMMRGMTRRSDCSSAAGALPRYEMRTSWSAASSSSRQNDS